MDRIDPLYLSVPALQAEGERLERERFSTTLTATRKAVHDELRDAIHANRPSLNFPLTGGSFFRLLDRWETDADVFEQYVVPELLDLGYTVRVYQPRWLWGLIKGDRRCEITWELR